MKGGSAIASGGFGCVFNPSIKCKNKKRLTGHVSKLLLTKYAESEINEVKSFINDLKSIKNYEDYFIIPEITCLPDKLTKEDKKNFDEKCFSLTNKNINSNNINNKLNYLKIIQLQQGGKDMDEYFNSNAILPKKFINVNNLLIKLLYNGIFKMNKNNVYHLDIKGSNILIKDEKLVRLIDWGLSEKITSGIPIQLKYRPMHFNMPYSIVLLNDLMLHEINIFLQENNENDFNYFNSLKTFLEKSYQNVFIKNVGKHHDDLINFILSNHVYSNKNSKDVIFSYMAQIVKHFTKNKKFDNEKYFKTVYLKNCDIWGFMCVYILLIIDNLHNIVLIPYDRDKFKEEVCSIFKNHIISNSYKPISIKSLIKDLIKLNSIFKQTVNNQTKTLKNSKTTKSFNKNSYQFGLTKSELIKKVNLSKKKVIKKGGKNTKKKITFYKKRKSKTFKISKKYTK